MTRKMWWYAGSFVVLVLLFWAILKLTIRDFGVVKLPVLNKVQNFTFTDESGRAFTEGNVDGKVYVTEYFFTTCPGICPKMNQNMKRIFDKFGSTSNFSILSHTSMPSIDTVQKMKLYEQRLLGDNIDVTKNNWFFLTGSKDSLYKMARESYLLDDIKNKTYKIEDEFIHTQFFALVDKDRRVRGIYDGLKEEELQKLERDINNLLEEPTEKGQTHK